MSSSWLSPPGTSSCPRHGPEHDPPRQELYPLSSYKLCRDTPSSLCRTSCVYGEYDLEPGFYPYGEHGMCKAYIEFYKKDKYKKD